MSIAGAAQDDALHHGRESQALAGLVAHSDDGLAVLDLDRTFVFVNPAAAHMLGRSPEQLVGTAASMFAPSPDSRGRPNIRTRATLTVDGLPRLLEVRESRDHHRILLSFRDLTEQSQRERHLSAFVHTATSMATATDSESLLSEIASCVLEATGQASCTLVLFDAEHGHVRQVGTAGGYPDDYAERLTECLRLGAPLASLGAFDSQAPFVAPGWRDKVISDARWAPVHDILRRQHWGSLVAVPLKTQSASLGSITLFYRRGLEPEQRDVDFLSTIGEMAAVAITNHQLAARMARKSALEERNRIARDLHDSVSQTMFSISLRARALQLASVSSSAAPAGMAEGLEQLHRLTSEALADMREMIHHLRPEALESEGLINLVQRHATSLHNQHGLDINVTSDVDTIDLPGADQLELLRIIQEAMGNAVRHSGSETLDVEFTADAERLAIKVIDNGSGFIIRRSPSGHFGLNTMSERATSIGATLTIESRPGHTVVHIEVPRSRGSLQ